MSMPKNVPAKRELERLEAIIRNGQQTFVEVGEALAGIKDAKLYKASGYSSFDTYCVEVWGFHAAYARRQITAAEQVKSAPTGALLPKTEREARARRKQAAAPPPIIEVQTQAVQLTIPWAVPHSQDAARLAHDDIAAKLGVGAAKSFLRDELTRLSKGALAPKPDPQPSEPASMPEGCTHPKPWTWGNGGVVQCAKCKMIRGVKDVWRTP